MILQALHDYYLRLMGDPTEDIAPPGLSERRLSFCLVLESDGRLAQIEDLREPGQRGKLIPRTVRVPDYGQKRTSADRPGFLCDKTDYVLGISGDATQRDRDKRRFELFKAEHLALQDLLQNLGYQAVCKFLGGWQPSMAEALSNWSEIAGQSVVFRLRGQKAYVHEDPENVSVWLEKMAVVDEDAVTAQCLVTGKASAIARLHPAIKGVYDPGGQAEKGIVAINKDKTAYESYGRTQSFNAPVSKEAAFHYSYALNRLLADRSRCVLVGDATTVFWTERPEPFERAWGPMMDSRCAECEAQLNEVRELFVRIAHGASPVSDLGPPETRFYVLGLSPNAARISIRFWLDSTIGEMAVRVSKHVLRLRVAGLDYLPTVRDMIAAVARVDKGKPDWDSISPRLAGDISRAILADVPLPNSFAASVLRRINASAQITPTQAACLKAWLLSHGEHAMDVYLNKVHPEKAYHCGRLMAVLVFIQDEALGSVNASLARRHLAAASMNPGLQLGMLQRRAEQGHLPKIDGDWREYLRDEMKAISTRLGDGLPSRLDHRGQSFFMLGFYQQLTYLEAKKAAKGSISSKRRTNRGEWVRSFGEVRVANALARLEVDYHYEPRALLETGDERWPDFVVFRSDKEPPLVIEYLGMPGKEYDDRWNTKLANYRASGISTEGGPRGRLIVIDERERQNDEMALLQLLRQSLSVLSMIEQDPV